MPTYEIIPVNVGEFTAFEKSMFVYRKDYGVKLHAPFIMYVVRNEDVCVVVDTGCSDPEWSMRHHGYPVIRQDHQIPDRALKGLGINPADVKYVVNTHLHWDHCFNNYQFPNAKIYVQKRELQYAICPLPHHCAQYESFQVGLVPPWIKAMTQFQVVDGDVSLLPGIDLVFLPGHTPGFQGVLVDTAKGKYLIAGDNVALFECWDSSGNHKHSISGLYNDLGEYWASLSKMEQLAVADRVLPGHDMKVFEHKAYPY
ncbi:MAG: N-acyl homoserine lactonase family protein [Candidatus Adiutrix sp.]|jgi:glyoxylase-like metal-dependent hydrolase (beta-lactamase superfamily II)|nr:N-acyl homoserine lactonase family protein [Candidatus Adiutrix sp.]